MAIREMQRISAKTHSRRYRLFRNQSGLSLIEIMIAMTLGSLLMLSIYKVFDLNQRSAQLLVDLNDREDNAQIALSVLADAIRMSGHWGGARASRVAVLNGAVSAPGACDTSWLFDAETPRFGWEGQASITQVKNFPERCLKQSDYSPRSDLLVVRYADSRAYFDDQTLMNKRYRRHFFVRSQAGDTAMIFQGKDAQTVINKMPQKAGLSTMAFVNQLYFIKPCQRKTAACLSNESVLTRLTLKGGRYIQEPLVEGIEQLQFEFGEDNNRDNKVDRYVVASAVSDWQRVRSVRIFLLARSRLKDTSIDQQGRIFIMNSHELTDKAIFKVPPEGRFYRYQRYQLDVEIKNPV